MKISINWLKEYVKFDKTPEQLADDLCHLGHEVEEIEKVNDDFILNLEITPNRGDCLSILGIARELAGLYDFDLNLKQTDISEENLNKDIEIKVLKPNICARFTARIIDDIKIQPSPKWMQERLMAYGFRPINNIVDITNYVMIETGQPLHAFDYNKIKTVDGRKLMRIRQAKSGEELTTLDGKKRFLNDDAIIIEDGEKIYDLAGIMGGLNSEVDENTTTIILQGSVFDPILIRKTSKFLNLTTEASYRFERGVDVQGTIYGVNLASKLILQTNPSAKIGPLKDAVIQQYTPREIKVSSDQINRLLGTNFQDKEIQNNLQRLNFQTKRHNYQIIAIVPSYRAFDVKNWQDLAEEVARMKGYNNLPKYEFQKQKAPILNKQYALVEFLKDLFVENGYTEMYSYSFVDEKTLRILGLFSDRLVEVKNPLSPETRYLRPNLIPSLLIQIAKNPWMPTIKIFEIGNCFDANKEFKQIAIAQSGKDEKSLRNLMELVRNKLNIDTFDFQILSINRKILEELKIRKNIIMTIINFESLLEKTQTIQYKPKILSPSQMKIRFKPISKFAPTIKDLSFIVDENVSALEMAKTIQSVDKKIRVVELFDEFRSDKFGLNKKSVAFHIWLEDLSSPIDEIEARNILKNIVDTISNKYHASLRGLIK